LWARLFSYSSTRTLFLFFLHSIGGLPSPPVCSTHTDQRGSKGARGNDSGSSPFLRFPSLPLSFAACDRSIESNDPTDRIARPLAHRLPSFCFLLSFLIHPFAVLLLWFFFFSRQQWSAVRSPLNRSVPSISGRSFRSFLCSFDRPFVRRRVFACLCAACVWLLTSGGCGGLAPSWLP